MEFCKIGVAANEKTILLSALYICISKEHDSLKPSMALKNIYLYIYIINNFKWNTLNDKISN